MTRYIVETGWVFLVLLVLFSGLADAYMRGGMTVIGGGSRYINITYVNFNHEPKYCTAKFNCITRNGQVVDKRIVLPYSYGCPDVSTWKSIFSGSCNAITARPYGNFTLTRKHL